MSGGVGEILGVLGNCLNDIEAVQAHLSEAKIKSENARGGLLAVTGGFPHGPLHKMLVMLDAGHKQIVSAQAAHAATASEIHQYMAKLRGTM